MAAIAESARGVGANAGSSSLAHEASHWREKAKIKEHEVKLLRQMVENAREELSRRDRSLESVAASLSRGESSRAYAAAGQADAMKVIETLERDLSERERRDKRVQAEVAVLRAQLEERNETLADISAQWERSLASVREARDADVKALEDKLKRELEEKAHLTQQLDETNALVATMKRELLEREQKISMLEARCAERVAIKDKEITSLSAKNKDLQLDIEHVMVAASKFARRDVKAVNNVVDLEESMPLGAGSTVPPMPPPTTTQPTAATGLFDNVISAQTPANAAYFSTPYAPATGANNPAQYYTMPAPTTQAQAQAQAQAQQSYNNYMSNVISSPFQQQQQQQQQQQGGYNDTGLGRAAAAFMSSIPSTSGTANVGQPSTPFGQPSTSRLY